MYEVFEHTADLGLRIVADDLPTLLAEAGRGLFSLMVANLDDMREVDTVNIAVEADDREYLLFDWLNELLYVFETRRLLLARFDVRLDGNRLTAQAAGETLDPARHVLAHEVKAITYHGLRVEPSADGWLAEVIVDI